MESSKTTEKRLTLHRGTTALCRTRRAEIPSSIVALQLEARLQTSRSLSAAGGGSVQPCDLLLRISFRSSAEISPPPIHSMPHTVIAPLRFSVSCVWHYRSLIGPNCMHCFADYERPLSPKPCKGRNLRYIIRISLG
ncbi:hypothetical protein VNO77_22586 [Canavalia gladiata]|uniref:Uncharacterized protein n=1 Tax=Canavalia gladiata TaxID=3824 RepID=A0AAN9L6B3_CANGL